MRNSPKKRFRPVPQILLLVAVLAALLAVFISSASMAEQEQSKLTKHDRELLAAAVASGEKTVTLLIASKPGATKSVISGLTALGATIRFRDDDLDYIRAIVPINKVDAAARLSGIQAVNLDELIEREDPHPGLDDADGTEAVPTAPGPTTPAENPQMPTRDIGAPQFVAAHPTYDGRGVKVAIVDSGVDVLTPELQTAKLIDGTPTRKIIQWVNSNDPFTGEDPSWVNMQTEVNVVGGTFAVGPNTYINVPADGTYRYGVFSESSISTGSEYVIDPDNNPATNNNCSDLNRNGVCNQSFAVLWRTSDDRVWVDSNADKNFASEPGMTNYDVNFDIGLFGTDNPATAVRESVPFTVQTDGKNKFVNIGVVGSSHATHVAGISTGKGFFGGAFNGAAPEAQVISVRVCVFGSACTNSGLIEGMIYAAKQANADVINMSIGGLPSLNDGNNTRTILYNRLIDQGKVQMFLSAGNSGPGLNTVGDPSVASRAVSVGAYVHKDTWFDNYGAVADRVDGIFVFSSRGPSEAGAAKPQIIASGSAVSCIPKWAPNFPLVGPLPPGYDMFNGTSMAAPQAAGGAALLISASKQTGVQYKPDQLRQAILSSARYLPSFQAYEQGNGLMQVGDAWTLLQTNIKTVEISSSAPVNTVLSGFLHPAGVGSGIYEREGWTAGQSATRNISFTRTSGAGGSKPVVYNLSLVGNDGTFSISAASIALPLNTPVSLPVSITTATNGVHSAMLNLDDPSTAGIDYQVLNTVVAAEQFTAANSYTVTVNGSADRPNMASFYFNVPAGTDAFKVDVTATAGRVRTIRQHPFGTPFDSTTTTAYCTAGTACQAGQPAGTISRTSTNPQSGVWEVTVDTSRASTVTPATFTVTVTIYDVNISPALWVVDPTTIGTVYNQNFTINNNKAAFTGNAVGTALGSAFSTTASIAAAGPDQSYNIVIPAGTTAVSASISGASDPAADLDLFLFDCTGPTCVLKSSGTTSSSNETVSSANPAAGNWKIVVSPFSVPAGSTTYNYLDVLTNPAFGTVAVADAPAVRPSGSSWTAPASAKALAAPAAGRYLRGFVRVQTGSTVLASAEVNLKNVAP